VARVGELHALRDARAIVQLRFLGGEPALFLSARREWDEQSARTELLARMAVREIELDGGPPIDGDAPPVPPGRIERCTDNLVEPAPAKTLDLLGDVHGAPVAAARVAGTVDRETARPLRVAPTTEGMTPASTRPSA
jgi:hypothetical protein